MKKWNPKAIITSSVALSLIIGGTAVYGYQHPVFAAESSSAVTTSSPEGHLKADRKSQGDGMKMKRSDQKEREVERGNIRTKMQQGASRYLENAAAVVGITLEELKAELTAGKSLVEIANAKGISQETLVANLTENANAKIDEAVKAGKLNEANADSAKKRAAASIAKIVVTKGLNDGLAKGHNAKHEMPMPGIFGMGGSHKSSFNGLPHDKIAAILGLTKEELAAGLKSGKSLSEIAAEKGITKDQLVAKIKDQLTPMLEKMVERKHSITSEKKSEATPAQ